MRQRRKSEGLKAVVEWVPATPNGFAQYSSHRLLDARSLVMHALIAQKIARNPNLLRIAEQNMARWRSRWPTQPPPWYLEWQQMLTKPWSSIAALITEPSEHANRLRQSTPFAGVLTSAERKRIYDAFRA
jgi:hypothetical protein